MRGAPVAGLPMDFNKEMNKKPGSEQIKITAFAVFIYKDEKCYF